MPDLPFQTMTQFAALGLTLVAGWLLGLASSSGGRKWRERYMEQDVENAGYRDRAENDLRDNARRIRDLEVERDRLQNELAAATAAAAAARDESEDRQLSPVAETVRHDPPVAAAAVPVAAAAAAAPTSGWRGWGRDNLVRIRGIDEAREQRLNELGIKTYNEIEKMTAEDEAALEQRLGLDPGAIAAGEWREQAALLRAGNEDEHARRFL
jgi:predicted flap endonuclease-1-like 5' DNA nuclease